MSKNIILILGNGFDLDLGRKTSYKDFYQSDFCPKDYPAPIIQHLNKKWPNGGDGVKWYDLETELYNYYIEHIRNNLPKDVFSSSEQAFINACYANMEYSRIQPRYSDVLQSLYSKGFLFLSDDRKLIFTQYLEDMKKPAFERDKLAFNMIKDGLCSYLLSLSDIENDSAHVSHEVLKSLWSSCLFNHNTLTVYNFNYTNIEQLLYESNLPTINYVHGSLKSKNIILGTRDSLDIGPNYFFLQKVYDHNYTSQNIVRHLQQADDVIFFGHSLGDNDSQYFMQFFVKQSSISFEKGKDITIFTFDRKAEIETKRSLQVMTENHLSSLINMNDFKILLVEEIYQNPEILRPFLTKYLIQGESVTSIINNLKQASLKMKRQ